MVGGGGIDGVINIHNFSRVKFKGETRDRCCCEPAASATVWR
jgi:hypothetical protein